MLLAVLLAGVGWFRRSILTDERTWYDENSVLLQGFAVSLDKPWPAVFTRAEVWPRPSVAGVLALTRTSAYPPGLPLLIFLFRDADNPIHALRSLVFIVGLVAVATAYVAARTAVGQGWALMAAAYVGSSTVLTHSSQQIKWSAFAQLASLLAGLSLLAWDRRPGQWLRAAYGLALVALLSIHYFGLWVLPGHGLHVAALARRQLWRWARSAAIALAVVLPWYAFALPLQLAEMDEHLDIVASNPIAGWNTAVGPASVLRAIGYDLLSALGVVPSLVRGRFLLPLLVLGAWCVMKALTSPVRSRRALASLAVACAGSGVAAQTLYAVKVGNVIPLQPHYLSPWFPLLMVTVIVGASEIPVPALRIAAVALIVGGSVGTLAASPTMDWIEASILPRDYSALCRDLTRVSDPSTAVVYRSDVEAKLVNLACPLKGSQAIGPAAVPLLPATVTRLVTLGECSDADRPAAACESNVRLWSLRRPPAPSPVPAPEGGEPPRGRQR